MGGVQKLEGGDCIDGIIYGMAKPNSVCSDETRHENRSIRQKRLFFLD